MTAKNGFLQPSTFIPRETGAIGFIPNLSGLQYKDVFTEYQDSWKIILVLHQRTSCHTYRKWSCGSLKTLEGSTANLFLFSFSTSRELEMFSKQPGSRTLILLLLKFLWDEKSSSIGAKVKKEKTAKFAGGEYPHTIRCSYPRVFCALP